MLLVVALGLLKLLWVVGCAGHLKKYGADAVNGAQVVGVDAEHFLEFRDGLIAETSVGFGGSARDVLAGVRRSQVQASVHEGWVELLGLFEILDGLVVLAVLEGVDTLIEEVASLQLVASGKSDDHQQSSRACQALERGAGRLGAKGFAN